MAKDKAWRRIRADWRDVVLVCRKCSKRIDGGFGPNGDQRLARALRREVDGPKVKSRRRELAVIEVGCLDVCPKGAVVAMRGGDPGRWLLVPRGAELSDVAERLGLPPRTPA